MASERTSRQTFYAMSVLVFTVSAALTWVCCRSMSAMPEMTMPGGWTMSMEWMRVPGQTWLRSAASFLAMWILMMVAMMLPSLAPKLWRYHQLLRGIGAAHPGLLIVMLSAGYFTIWALIGMAVFPLGVTLAAVEMHQPALARSVPITVGAIVAIAGALQFTAWKAHRLASCREAFGCGGPLPASPGWAWHYGLQQGLHCGHCCATLTAVLLACGVMNLRAMTLVTLAISVERLALPGERVARVIGVAVLGTGLWLMARASGLG